MKPLIKWGAVAAIVGGVLRIVATFIPYLPHSAALESLYGVIDVCLMFGLIALYLDTGNDLGGLGLGFFAVALIGIASIIGPDPTQFGIDFYQAGSAVFLVGMTGLSVCLFRRGRYRIPACLWMASALLGVAASAGAGATAFAGAGLLLGAGFLTAGIAVARFRPTTTGPSGRNEGAITL
jgi:hypothetical protein